MKIGLSACLYGQNVRYDGTDKKNEAILKLLEGHEIILICPELSAGFEIPHDPLEIDKDKVFTCKGQDVTEKLERGCLACLEKVKDCDLLILKQKSPSCGKGKIYDGSFSGKLMQGNGIFTKLCLKQGLKIFSEEEISDIKKEL